MDLDLRRGINNDGALEGAQRPHRVVTSDINNHCCQIRLAAAMASSNNNSLNEPAHEAGRLSSEADDADPLAARQDAEQDGQVEVDEDNSSEWDEESMFGDALEALSGTDMDDRQSFKQVLQ